MSNGNLLGRVPFSLLIGIEIAINGEEGRLCPPKAEDAAKETGNPAVSAAR
jgi:hypothetical protein